MTSELNDTFAGMSLPVAPGSYIQDGQRRAVSHGAIKSENVCRQHLLLVSSAALRTMAASSRARQRIRELERFVGDSIPVPRS